MTTQDWELQRSLAPFNLLLLLLLGCWLLTGCEGEPDPKVSSTPTRGKVTSHTSGHSHSGDHHHSSQSPLEHEHDHDHAHAHDHEHEHDHEHDHAHHHDPAYKPADFPAAVQHLQAFQQLISSNTSPSRDQLAIIEEIVHWLPELAAQSELRESQWNQVDRSSQILLDWLRVGDFSSTARNLLDQELVQLNLAVAAYKAAEAEFLRRLGGDSAAVSENHAEGGE